MPTTYKIALVVGHRPGAQGAVSVGGVSEYAYNEPLSRMLANELTGTQRVSVDPVIVHRPDHKRGYHELPGLVNATGAACCVSLHFNASKDPGANGTECLHAAGSEAGKRLAQEVATRTQSALNTRLRHAAYRGALGRGKSGRGGTLLYGTTMPTVIAEPAFGSNRPDWLALQNRQRHLAVAYARAIEAWLKEAIEEGWV